MNKNQGSGFTLTELMVVIAIIGIIASIATPSFVGMIQRAQLVIAAEAFNADFQYAKMESVKQNKFVYLAFTGTGATWCYGISNTANCDCRITDTTDSSACAVWEDADKDAIQDADEKILKVISNNSFTNILLSEVSYGFGSTQLVFSPITASVSSNGHVTFTNNAGSVQVVTTIYGKSHYCAVNSAIGGYTTC